MKLALFSSCTIFWNLRENLRTDAFAKDEELVMSSLTRERSRSYLIPRRPKRSKLFGVENALGLTTCLDDDNESRLEKRWIRFWIQD